MKAEPETRLENGHDVRFSIDDLAAKTQPEPWDGKFLCPNQGIESTDLKQAYEHMQVCYLEEMCNTETNNFHQLSTKQSSLNEERRSSILLSFKLQGPWYCWSYGSRQRALPRLYVCLALQAFLSHDPQHESVY